MKNERDVDLRPSAEMATGVLDAAERLGSPHDEAVENAVEWWEMVAACEWSHWGQPTNPWPTDDAPRWAREEDGGREDRGQWLM